MVLLLGHNEPQNSVWLIAGEAAGDAVFRRRVSSKAACSRLSYVMHVTCACDAVM